MGKEEEKSEAHDIIDKDLYEEIPDEELIVLVEEARAEALLRAKERKEDQREPKSPFPRWIFWLIAFALLINVVGLLPQTLSIPAIDFLYTSAKLSTQADVKEYKESIAVIKAGDSKGTGFVITPDGELLTNYHVVEGYDTVQVNLPDLGFFSGEVVEEYPEIDLAVVKLSEEDLPFLDLADEFVLEADEEVYFIGNPLNFIGIANRGQVIAYVGVGSKDAPVVMMDAPVYRGNSGSPVIDMNGEVIGVVYATLEHGTEGKVGLFIPIDYLYAARAD